jgi:CheY-like chemotaxis protein
VDDDAGVSQAVARDLRRQYGEDFRILRADSGASALEVLRRLKLRGDDAALLLVDYRMPEMNGITFFKHSIEVFPEAKRVLLTAYADTSAAIQAINEVQLHHYLLKPWDPPEEKLYPIIDELIEDWFADHRPAFEGVRVIGHRWSARSHEVKDFLARNLVPYQWLDVEDDPEAQQLLAASGIDEPVRWLADAREQVDAALREHGALTARELGQKVPALTHKIVMAPGKKYSANVSAHTRVLLQLGFEGKVVRGRPTGTWVNGAYRYAAMDDWLDGGVGALDRREAARELVDRYLRRFGPVTTKDVQWWAGWTLATTKAALRDCEAEPVSLEEGDGWVAAGDRELFDEQAWVGVLPSLDPTTMGWKEREWYLPAEAEDTFDRYGNAGPTLWVDGEVVGAWAQAPDGELRSTYLVPVSARRRRQVAARLDDVAAMIGDTRFTVRFPGRVNAKLLAD